MSSPPENSHPLVAAIILFVRGATLLLRMPGVVRVRAYFAALHVLALGFAVDHFSPEHDLAIVSGYVTALLLWKATRSGPPPAQGQVPDSSDLTSV